MLTPVVKLDMTTFMSLIVLSIYIIIEADASWYNTLDDTLSSLNTLLYWYSSPNMLAAIWKSAIMQRV